ncbi:MAG: hypothetical protein [Chaetfec virus UA24_144]|nr:MAG: hypothetical protein [Chaetfec virus UA24_144]
MLEFMKRNEDVHTLDDEIQDLLDQMSQEEAWTEKYSTMSQNYDRLMEAKSKKLSYKVIPAMASGGVTLLGIFMIMKFEKLDIITTKAFQLLPKVKAL